MRGVTFRKATFRLILVFLYIFIQLEESTFDGGETEREREREKMCVYCQVKSSLSLRVTLQF